MNYYLHWIWSFLPVFGFDISPSYIIVSPVHHQCRIPLFSKQYVFSWSQSLHKMKVKPCLATGWGNICTVTAWSAHNGNQSIDKTTDRCLLASHSWHLHWYRLVSVVYLSCSWQVARANPRGHHVEWYSKGDQRSIAQYIDSGYYIETGYFVLGSSAFGLGSHASKREADL